MKKMIFLALLVFLIGCQRNFNYGVSQINIINSKHNTTMENYPSSVEQIDLMIKELQELKNIQLASGKEQLDYAVNYRILNLEAEKLFIEGNKYGNVGFTKDGFSCKQRPLVTESLKLRNESVQKGFESVDLLDAFVAKYPEEALMLGLSAKGSLFLNASFYQVWKEARSDSSAINSMCPQNRTLELYKKEIKQKTEYGEDYINGLEYEEAVKIWKEIRGIK